MNGALASVASAQLGIFLLLLIWLAVFVFVTAGVWRTFEKAGQPGWACIIPFYNIYVMTQIAGRPWWWLFLLLIPCAGLIFAIIVCIDVAKNFGQDTLFGLGLAFFGFIFFPVLGFGSAVYQRIS